MAASKKSCICKPVEPQAVALGKDVSVAIMLKSGGSTSPVGVVMDGGVGRGLFGCLFWRRFHVVSSLGAIPEEVRI